MSDTKCDHGRTDCPACRLLVSGLREQLQKCIDDRYRDGLGLDRQKICCRADGAWEALTHLRRHLEGPLRGGSFQNILSVVTRMAAEAKTNAVAVSTGLDTDKPDDPTKPAEDTCGPSRRIGERRAQIIERVEVGGKWMDFWWRDAEAGDGDRKHDSIKQGKFWAAMEAAYPDDSTYLNEGLGGVIVEWELYEHGWDITRILGRAPEAV